MPWTPTRAAAPLIAADGALLAADGALLADGGGAPPASQYRVTAKRWFVLAFFSLANMNQSLVQLHLQITDPLNPQALTTESLELTPAELDATIEQLDAISEAMRTLPQPGGSAQ